MLTRLSQTNAFHEARRVLKRVSALERKEAAWREAHPEAEGEPVPAEALRRDVAWSAMRRMLERCPREVVGE